MRSRHEIGLAQMMWASDFPHGESDWPDSQEIIDEIFHGVPDDEQALMLGGNAVNYFRLDPAVQSPRSAAAALYPRGLNPNVSGPEWMRSDPMRHNLFRFCSEAACAPIQMAFVGVWDRFPALQIYWAETNIGWISCALWQIDEHYERYAYDFPHVAGDWPSSRGVIEKNFAGVPDDERALMLGGNAVRFFNLGE